MRRDRFEEQICGDIKSCKVVVLPQVAYNTTCEVVLEEDKLYQCLKINHTCWYVATKIVLPKVEG
jgi:type II secretory pathway component PulL